MKPSKERQALMQYLLHLEGEPVFDEELLGIGRNLLELRWKEIEENLGDLRRWVDKPILKEIWLNFFEPVVINLEITQLPKSFFLFLLNNSLARDFLADKCDDRIFPAIEEKLRALNNSTSSLI